MPQLHLPLVFRDVATGASLGGVALELEFLVVWVDGREALSIFYEDSKVEVLFYRVDPIL